MLQWFQSNGKPCTATTSRCSRTPWACIFAINIGSMGEMPPSTRSRRGFSAATAAAASLIMLAKVRHSGSSSNAQCDLLFGSFQNITASIMGCLPLAVCLAGRIDRPRPIWQFLAAADKDFLLRMAENVKASAAQQCLGAGAIGNPPVGGIAGIGLFDKVQAWKTRLGENL